MRTQGAVTSSFPVGMASLKSPFLGWQVASHRPDPPAKGCDWGWRGREVSVRAASSGPAFLLCGVFLLAWSGRGDLVSSPQLGRVFPYAAACVACLCPSLFLSQFEEARQARILSLEGSQWGQSPEGW